MLIRAVVAVLLLLVALVAASSATAATKTEPYTVLTYNAAGLPETPASIETFGNLHDGPRGAAIADKIKGGDYDVVALNEVFDETMRDVLDEKLAATYPDRVISLDDGLFSDSGLMLFSKFNFMNFTVPQSVYDFECVEDDNGSTPDGQCIAAYHEFVNTEGADRWASKGIGYARLQNPRTNRPLHFFFTHMQATYPDDTYDTRLDRQDQVREARVFIKSLAPVEAGEEAIFAGDLNVVGDAGAEYTEAFTSDTTGFKPLGFVDSFRHATAPEDRGFTFDGRNNAAAAEDPSARERLDYILHRPWKGEASCYMHHTLERHFKVPETHLSDHFGLKATIGAVGPQCSPKTAKVDMIGSQAGELTHPRSMQWFRYNRPDTYTVEVTADEDLEVTPYLANDLSTPIGLIKGTTKTLASKTSSFTISPQQPFYLRVTAPTAYDAKYTIKVRRHHGTSYDDFEFIRPYEFRTNSFAQIVGADAGDLKKRYYRFATDTLYSGAQQNLVFKTGGPPGLRLRVRLETLGKTLVTQTPGFAVGQSLAGKLLPAAGAGYYLIVERETTSQTGTFNVAWETDLRSVRLWQVNNFGSGPVMWDRPGTWDIGADQLQAVFSIDDGANHTIDLGEVDSPAAKNIRRTYNVTKRVKVTLREVDVGTDDWLGTDNVLTADHPLADLPATDHHLSFLEDEPHVGIRYDIGLSPEQVAEQWG